MVFELRGTRLPIDHGLALYRELARLVPCLEESELAGVHPVHGSDSGSGELMLNRRTRLVIRIPSERIDDLQVLSGQTLNVAGNTLTIGTAKLKPLPHHTPLYARLVTTGSVEEIDFVHDIMRMLDDLNIETRFLCGLRQTVTDASGVVSGYSLMLHGLPIEHAIRVQQIGLGSNRKIGCGIFVPHKSIAALV